MNYPPQQPGFDPNQPPPGGQPGGFSPQQPGGFGQQPPQQPGYGAQPPQQPGYGQQPGFDPNQPPPQQPGFDPNQPPQPGGFGQQPQPNAFGQQPFGPPQGQPGAAPGIPGQAPKKSKTGLFVGVGAGVIVLAAAIVLLVLQPWAGSGPSASDAPKDVAQEYLDTLYGAIGDGALEDADKASAAAEDLQPFMCSEYAGEFDPESTDEMTESMQGLEFDVTPEVTGESVEGEKATVDVKLTGTVSMPELGSQDVDETMQLDMVKEEDTWKVCGLGMPEMGS